MKKIKLLFVCMGNICRSPTAEGVFTHFATQQNLLERFEIDSAGTHAYHIGEQPDHRSQLAAEERGIKLSHLRARKVIYGDFEDYDYLLVMDDDNYKTMIGACPSQYQEKIKYFLDYAPELGFRQVPDPYYGGGSGFDNVLDMIETASTGFLAHLKTTGEL